MSTESKNLVMSHLTLRKAIGILGALHPFILLIGGFAIFDVSVLDAMSNYYYTGMRDVFVSIIVSTGLFLFAYKGYERSEDILGDVAFLLTLGIAFFPMTPDVADPTDRQILIGYIHIFSAVSFLFLLAYFSICLFTKSSAVEMSTKKKQRNKVYRISGYVILVSMVLMATFLFALTDDLRAPFLPYKPIFWLETLCLVAFGVSWFVKGEAILKD